SAPIRIRTGPRPRWTDPDPRLAAGGSHDQQAFQRDKTATFAVLALKSCFAGHTPVIDRSPPDDQVTSILDPLDTHPPIGTDCEDVTHIVYQSIPNATAAEGSEQYVGDPDGAFGAGGMEIRPRTD